MVSLLQPSRDDPPTHLSTKRIFLHGSFLIVFLVASALFIPTFTAQLTIHNAASIDATPSVYHIETDAKSSVLLVRIRVHNPTSHTVTFLASETVAYRHSNRLTQHRVTSLSKNVVVPPGETVTVTVQLPIEDGYRTETRAAVTNDEVTVRGFLYGEVVNKRVKIEISQTERTDH